MKKNFKNFLSGKIVDLVTIDKNFVENTDWFDWINFELNTEFLTVGNFPNTLAHQKKYFSEQIVGNKRIQLGIVTKHDRNLLGVISLYSINSNNRDAFISTFFDRRKKIKNSLSIFVDVHKIIIGHAFKKMNLRRITSTTISKDLDDLISKILGFKKEGTMKKKVFKNNKYHDLYISSIIKNK